MRHESLKNPKVIAIEAVGFAFLAWQLKRNYDSRHDKPNDVEPLTFPLNAYDDETQIYLYQGHNGNFEAGAIHPTEGYIEVQGTRTVNESGEGVIVVDESASEKDPNRLQILRESFQKLYMEFSDRDKS